jgi:hypothetical protein
MLKLAISVGTAAGVLLATQVAQAHLLECTKTVNGTNYIEISEYPATVRYDFSIHNPLTTEDSCVISAEDSALADYANYSFDPAPPYCMEPLATHSDYIEIDLMDYEECLELAAADSIPDARLDNVFVVTWDTGAAMCFATVVCMPPGDDGGPTRTPGYYKTHESALEQCLAEGSIDLGAMSVDTLAEALGLLWGSPATYSDGTKRSSYDQAWFLLARHTLVATCNTRLFGTDTEPANLIEQAIAALSGTDCDLMKQLQGMLDAYNNSGTEEDFPEGFDGGPATPTHAQSLASDPTSPTNLQCE